MPYRVFCEAFFFKNDPNNGLKTRFRKDGQRESTKGHKATVMPFYALQDPPGGHRDSASEAQRNLVLDSLFFRSATAADAAFGASRL